MDCEFEIGGDIGEAPFVVGFGAEGADMHGHYTVSASIFSYSAWVPMARGVAKRVASVSEMRAWATRKTLFYGGILDCHGARAPRNDGRF
jgi:hypothetical protein